MRTVRIIKDWDQPNILQQTPGGNGVWGDIRVVLDPGMDCDYAFIMNRVPQQTVVKCPPRNIWVFFHEPPCPEYKRLPTGTRKFYRVYTQDTGLCKHPFVHGPPALPWQISRDYDFLVKCGAADKPRELSWVTSNLQSLQGHRKRLGFLAKIRGRVPFDLFGAGFQPIADKWDGLAPYRYSLAVENFRNPYYWTEKIADCFLAWTMPIYYGCTRITDYFPAESMVQLDIEDPDAIEKLREAVASDRWTRNRDAIAHARELVLNKYQLFPFLAAEIEAHEKREGVAQPAVEQVLPAQPYFRMYPLYWAIRTAGRLARRALKRLKRRLGRAKPPDTEEPNGGGSGE
jgi:hypothetical protein